MRYLFIYRYRVLAFVMGAICALLTILVIESLRPKPDLCMKAAQLVYTIAQEEGDLYPPSVRKLYSQCVWEQAVGVKL